VAAFYAELFAALGRGKAYCDGTWSLIPPQPVSPGNATAESCIAYAWRAPGESSRLVVVNCSEQRAQCRLRLPFPELVDQRLRFAEEMSSAVFACHGDDPLDQGICVDLGKWGYVVLRLDRLDG
jgi:hypothetical protein